MRRRKRMLEGLDQDIREHIAMETQDNIERGMSPEEARYAAVRKFGNVTRVKEDTRDVWSVVWLEQLLQDIRFGLRVLRKSPGFAVVAILTLALGIGANTAIFSVVNAVLLQPLPYPNANRLAIIWSQWGNETRGPASGPEMIELRNRSRVLDEIGGIWATSGTITGTAEPEQVRLAFTTANFLPLLAEKPQLGRFFAPGEDRGGAAPLMILTDGLWRRQFGANPGIIGQTARLNGNDFTVVGVLPRDFKLLFPDGSGVIADVQVFIPFLNDLEKTNRDTGYINDWQAAPRRDGGAGAKRSGIDCCTASRRSEGIRRAVAPPDCSFASSRRRKVGTARAAFAVRRGWIGVAGYLRECRQFAAVACGRQKARGCPSHGDGCREKAHSPPAPDGKRAARVSGRSGRAGDWVGGPEMDSLAAAGRNLPANSGEVGRLGLGVHARALDPDGYSVWLGACVVGCPRGFN